MYTDSFILFLKAVMIFGKVTDYNTRSNLRANAPPSKNQNPFVLPGFKELDRLVAQDFLQSLPAEFKHLDITSDGVLDTDLYMVHLVPHACVLMPVSCDTAVVEMTPPQCRDHPAQPLSQLLRLGELVDEAVYSCHSIHPGGVLPTLRDVA